jgi:hypothetical protein
MGKTQINFQIGEDEKEKWEEHAEDSPNADSLSNLIRVAVRQHMNGSGGPDRSDSTSTDTEATGEVLNALNRIENDVSELGDRLGAVERETEVEQTYDLQKAVFAFLPTLEVPKDGEKAFAGDVAMTAEEIGTKLGADTEDVTDALGSIMASTQSVRMYEPEDDEPMYFRVDAYE